jgi:hypothetical protein
MRRRSQMIAARRLIFAGKSSVGRLKNPLTTCIWRVVC